MTIRLPSVSRLRLDPELAVEPIEWRRVFGRDGRVEVEIGIGKGRFLLACAAARPDVLHFGIEWSNEYLRLVETRAERFGLDNVRFVRADASDVVRRAIPDGSVSTYYVFYPDPWPKKRHHKRRFLQAENVKAIARTLVPEGWLHVATDHDDYWNVIEPLLDARPDFARESVFGGPEFPIAIDGPLTNFEAKYEVEGRRRHRGSWRRRDVKTR